MIDLHESSGGVGAATASHPSRDRSISQARLVAAMEEVMDAMAAEQPCDRDALLAKYADVADELAECLSNLDFVQNVAPQLADEAAAYPASSIEHPTSSKVSLGDFRIVREIGRGGMGVVYEAEQLSLGRRVALKVLPFAAMLDKQQLARFKNEARAAATLDHANIVAIYSVGLERGVHYYAMQLIEGQSLAQVVEQLRKQRDVGYSTLDVGSHRPSNIQHPASSIQHPPSRIDTEPVARLSTLPDFSTKDYYRTIAQLGIQAAEALDHAHQNGILHRDIKPANLMIDDTGKLWITDFGLARLEADAGMTMTGDILGTLRYMSPEQALAKRVVVDHRSDIYSLGVTLYELLTLQPAFTGEDRQELLRQIAFEEPRRPRQINSRIPQDLETILLKSIEKNPAQRYATAHDLSSDILKFVEHQPIKAKPPTALDRIVKWFRRHPASVRAIIVSILVSTVVLAGSIGWTMRDRQAQRVLATATTSLTLNATELMRWGRLDEAISISSEAIRLKPDFAEAHFNLARALKEKGLRHEAIASYQNAIRFNPKFAVAHRHLGVALSEVGFWDQAETAMRESIRLRPDFPEAHNDLANLLDSRNLLDDAIAEYREALKWNPNDSNVHANLGATLHKVGRLDDAIDCFQKSIRLNPTSAAAYYFVCMLYFEKGELDKTISCLTHAIRLSAFDDKMFPNAYDWLEVALYRKGGIQAVTSAYDEALQLHPENPILHLRLAEALQYQGKTALAITSEGEAKQLIDNDNGSPTLLGDYYVRVERFPEAAEKYVAAMQDNRNDAGIAVRAAFLLFISGDRYRYEAMCRNMLDQFSASTDLDAIRRTCWVCLISNPPVGDLEQLMLFSEKVVQGGETALTCRERGLAAYRHRDWEDALKWCRKSRSLLNRTDRQAQNLFVEAMVFNQLGDANKAQAAFDDALRMTQRAFPATFGGVHEEAFGERLPDWIDYVYCELLRREAEALLKPQSPKPPPAGTDRQTLN